MKLVLIAACLLPLTAAADPESQPALFDRPIALRITEGDLLPWMASAHHEQPGVLVSGFAGRDASTGTNVLVSAIQAALVDRVSVRASFANDGYDPRMRATAGVTVDALRQDAHGIDLAVGADYAQRGFNQVPAVIAHVAAARHFGPTTLLANLELGVGLEDSERYGAAGLGLVHAVTAHWSAGLSSQARLDLERDATEPAGERDYDLQAGPVVTYAVGPVAVSALGGVSAWQLRLDPDRHVGAIAMLGAGALF